MISTSILLLFLSKETLWFCIFSIQFKNLTAVQLQRDDMFKMCDFKIYHRIYCGNFLTFDKMTMRFTCNSILLRNTHDFHGAAWFGCKKRISCQLFPTSSVASTTMELTMSLKLMWQYRLVTKALPMSRVLLQYSPARVILVTLKLVS